ncbi:MAG: carbohydrate ABC transporter permease [Candidatus Limnocylindrales bacterium]
MSAESITTPSTDLVRSRRLRARVFEGRDRYLLGAVCVALCAIMVVPIILSVLQSLKTTGEAAASPPTWLPTEISLDSYQRLWEYQFGLPTYVMNSLGTALLAIVFTLGLTIPAGFALARLPVPGKEILFLFLLMSLIIPYQALLTPIFLLFAQGFSAELGPIDVSFKLTNSMVGLAILHTAIQLPFSLYIMRNSFEAVPRELEEAAVIDGGGTFAVLRRVLLPAIVPAIVTVALFAFITSWNEFLGAIVLMSKADSFTLPVVLAAARTETSLGGTDWGMLQAGIVISMIPCILFYLLLQRYYVSGLTSGAVK